MVKRLIHYLSAGVYAGLLIALIEAIDRSVVLKKNFLSSGEWLLFVCTLAFIPAFNLLLGVIIAALCALSEKFLTRVKESMPGWADKPIFALAVSAPLILLFILTPSLKEEFRQLLIGISDRIVKLSPIVAFSTLLL